MNIDRDTAVALLNKYITTEHIKTHSFAVEAVMRALAKRLSPEDVDLWGIAGLLHDLDNDLVDWKSDMSLHGNEAMYNAILAHNPATGKKVETLFENALYSGDPITGFINAITLVYPDRKIASVKVKSIVKRMGETRFAAGANREAMWAIENTGIEFEDFAKLSLDAMKEISDVLGL